MTNEIKTQQELLLAIRNGEMHPERSTAYWTPEERAELQRLYRDGQGISEIALLLQRSESAVFQQLLAMGMLAGQGKPRQRNPPSGQVPVSQVFGVGMSPLRQGGGMLLFEAFDDILSVEEASVALKMGKNAIYELLLNKEIRGFKNGRVWRISKAELVEYVKKASKT